MRDQDAAPARVLDQNFVDHPALIVRETDAFQKCSRLLLVARVERVAPNPPILKVNLILPSVPRQLGDGRNRGTLVQPEPVTKTCPAKVPFDLPAVVSSVRCLAAQPRK